MPNETTPACDVAKSLWKQLLDADADSCNPDCDDQTRAPVALLEKALADARREGEEAGRKEVPQPIGECPKTADGVRFAMGAWLYAWVDDELVECGPLQIKDPDTMHFEDYPEGKRWEIRVRDTEGCEHDLHEGDLFSSREAALSAKEPRP